MPANARLYCPRVELDSPSFIPPGAEEVSIQLSQEDPAAPPAYAYLRATGVHDPDGLQYWTEPGAELPAVEERP